MSEQMKDARELLDRAYLNTFEDKAAAQTESFVMIAQANALVGLAESFERIADSLDRLSPCTATHGHSSDPVRNGPDRGPRDS